MGSVFADEMANELEDFGIYLSIEEQIRIQLRSNHYPPAPTSMIEPCIEAINACNEDESDRLIELPEGVLWRGQTTAPAYAIVEGHHLEAWLDES